MWMLADDGTCGFILIRCECRTRVGGRENGTYVNIMCIENELI